MSHLKTEKVKMKPRWFFVIGSIATLIGLIGILILSTFLVSLISFTLRAHGPMGAIRYQQLIQSFPWWSVIVILVGLGSGTSLLKQYDFSYKKNFSLIMVVILAAIIVSGLLIDVSGLDNLWIRRGPMRLMYQQHYPDWRWQR